MLSHIATVILLIVVSCFFSKASAGGCIARSLGQDSIVCVCNCTYCDEAAPRGNVGPDTAVVYTTTKTGLRYERTTVSASLQTPPTLLLDCDTKFQQIRGFGGAFTYTSSYNVKAARNVCVDPIAGTSLADTIIRQLFDPDHGNRYTLARTSMGANDATPVDLQFTYDDVVDDFNLINFALNSYDIDLQIPFMRQAMTVSNGELKCIGSMWSPPGWMKQCDCLTGGTTETVINNRQLKGAPGGPYYQAYALYLTKFIKAYKDNGVKLWAITTDNEPVDSHILPWPSLVIYPWQEAGLVGQHLGPTLAAYNLSDVGIFIYDENRFPFAPLWVGDVMNDTTAAPYVKGVATHSFWDTTVPPELILDPIHLYFPQLEIINTEAYSCRRDLAFTDLLNTPMHIPNNGLWYVAARQADNIMQDINHWTTGWMDWSMVSDINGQPAGYGPIDAVIIFNSSGSEFYKNPTYYTLGHFSKWVPPGSYRILLTGADGTKLQGVAGVSLAAFLTPDGTKVVVANNNNGTDITIQIALKPTLSGLGVPPPKTYPIFIPQNSVVTALIP